MAFDRFQSAGYMTNWTARLFARSIDRRLKPMGVASAHLPVIFALAGGKEATQGDLARLAAIEQPTMAATLNRMEKAGFIVRQPDPADGRRTLIRLSSEAERLTTSIRDAVEAVNQAALAQLTEAERNTFLEMLSHVASALETESASD